MENGMVAMPSLVVREYERNFQLEKLQVRCSKIDS